MRDVTLEDTAYFFFTTRQFSDGVPTTLAGSPVLSVIEQNNATPITAGVSVQVDRATVTGLNQATVVATAANGYAQGSYAIYISTGTVGGVSVVGEVVAEFTVNDGAAFRRLGAPAGASVSADIADVPTVAEFNARTLAAADYFDPAADTVANVTTTANVTTVNGLAAGVVTAAAIATDAIDADALAADAVAEIADGVWDEVLTGAAHNVVNSAGRRLRAIQESGAYSGGAIYIDTVNGTAGTTDFENGTDSNPVDSIADANTLAASRGISRFRIAPGSTITLAAAQTSQVFDGYGWTLALGGQNISSSTFIGASVSGIGTNTTGVQRFVNCHMNATTVPTDTHWIGCHIDGTQTIGEAGDYFMDQCFSAVAGSGTPVVDINSVANVDLSVRHYSGGMQVNNAVATTTMSYESDGQIVIDATCTSLAVTVRGNCSITDNGTTTALTQDAAVNRTNINAEADTALADINLDHLVGTATAIPAVPAGTYLDQIMDDGTATFDRTTDSLQAIADSGGGGPTAAQIADAVWDEAQADHVAAGSFGVTATEIADILVDTAEIGAAGAGLTAIPWNAAWDAEVQSECADALTAYDAVVPADLPANFADLSITLTTGRIDVGAWLGTAVTLSTGNLPDVNAAEISDSAPTADAVETNIGNLDAAVSGAATPAEVATEIADALATDTYVEVTAVPAATSTLADRVGWLFALARNEIQQTATLATLRNDADTGNIATAGVSDNGTTFQRDEWV